MDNNIVYKRTEGEYFVYANDRIKAGDTFVFTVIHQVSFEETKANAAFICKAVNNYDSLLAENEKLKRLLEDLTPGGSEFVNDPQYCFDFVKKEINSIPSQILPFKKRAEKLQVTNDSLLSALKTVTYEYKQSCKLLAEANRMTYSENSITISSKKTIKKAEQ